MAACETMKVGEIYECPKCGLEIQVRKSCDCAHDETCEPHVEEGVCCDFECCGEKLTKKK